MSFENEKTLKAEGFIGFIPIKSLKYDLDKIPNEPGVYMVILPNRKNISFRTQGTGGYFKGKDPNVSLDKLNDNWVSNTCVAYIGKAGGDNSSSLKARIKLYLEFGIGKNVGHYGGRYIWQIEQSDELIICWKPILDDVPRKIEKGYIQLFKSIYNKRPFANLQG